MNAGTWPVLGANGKRIGVASTRIAAEGYVRFVDNTARVEGWRCGACNGLEERPAAHDCPRDLERAA